jgi:hypothetical protein
MTTDQPAVATTGATATDVRRVPDSPSRPWRRGGLLLAGAAQLITISALTGADRVPATWSALLLAVAPALLAAVALFAPAPANMLGLAAAVVAIVVGGIGQILHTGLFFVPALVLLVVGGVKLWRERSQT